MKCPGLTFWAFLIQYQRVDQRQQASNKPCRGQTLQSWLHSVQSDLLTKESIMAISKEKKHAIVSTFSDIVSGAESVVFVQFNKLTVANSNALRRKLRASDVGYKVGKKTLLKRVLAEQGYTGELPVLDGEIAVAYSADPLAAAREVYDFQLGHKGIVSIVGGVFEKGYKNQAEMLSIATIPPLQTLRGMFVNIINSPIQRFAIALDQIAKKNA